MRLSGNWHLPCVLLFTLPLLAETPKAHFLGPAKNCERTLPDGRRYQVSRRLLHWIQGSEDWYADAFAYYMPGTGEFMWRGTTYTKHGYDSWVKGKPQPALCKLFAGEFLELRDGEWADFSGMSGSIEIYHGRLRFGSIEKAWKYVQLHPDEMPGAEHVTRPGYDRVNVYPQLGSDFFRPERLHYDARPYSYPSITSVRKIDKEWHLEIKGADPPNRAVVILDGGFKLLNVLKDQ